MGRDVMKWRIKADFLLLSEYEEKELFAGNGRAVFIFVPDCQLAVYRLTAEKFLEDGLYCLSIPRAKYCFFRADGIYCN